MNPTVITTGPGVIIATATASTNWRSVSQWYSFTTPPYRTGTMASPLPKTNAPASPKNTAILRSVGQSSVDATADAVGSWSAAMATPGSPPLPIQFFGGARISQTSTPAPRKSQTISDCVTIVTIAATR